ncbi:hypothetical protein J1N35_035016 [Gossypium stocksii]|uniref:Uncharacterized protein n=1 Tax=Gossypium stocksii TaxID=47602 RepID=A0A9D3UTG2_9ROSI|nr:hypothetical protein J1N35_035016 [Gossypium stocksii]
MVHPLLRGGPYANASLKFELLLIVEQKRTIKFLLGLNKDLDEVRGRVMGIKPFPTIWEAFVEVQREESIKKLTITNTNISSIVKGLALYTQIISEKQGWQRMPLV